MIFKSLWAHKKQDGWIIAEIAIITCLSWFIVDYLVTCFYATHFCIPAGEFEKDHLCVGQLGIVRSESASEGQVVTEEESQGIYVIKEKLENMPEVASVSLTPNYLNAELRLYTWRTLSLADDSTKTIGIAQMFYYPFIYWAITGLAKVLASMRLHQPHQSVYTSMKTILGSWAQCSTASSKLIQWIFSCAMALMPIMANKTKIIVFFMSLLLFFRVYSLTMVSHKP